VKTGLPSSHVIASSSDWLQSENITGSGGKLRQSRDSSINWDGLVEEVFKKQIGVRK
jgi:hypothetical protein